MAVTELVIPYIPLNELTIYIWKLAQSRNYYSLLPLGL